MKINCPNCEFEFDVISKNPKIFRCHNCGCVYTTISSLPTLSTLAPSNNTYASIIKKTQRTCPLDGSILRLNVNAFNIPFLSPFVCEKCQNYLLYPDDLPIILHSYLDPQVAKKYRFSFPHYPFSTFIFIFLLTTVIFSLILFFQGNIQTSKASEFCESHETIQIDNNTFAYLCHTSKSQKIEYSLLSCDGIMQMAKEEDILSEFHIFEFKNNDCYLLINSQRNNFTRIQLR